jgi:hypothetical protein
MKAKLHELQAEQIGARTGELYDYQYHQAANASLLLLDGDVHYVYCEWHDDYVLESVDGRYEFHQVKTRLKKHGPWRIADFFGTPKKTKKANPADKGSHFLKMFKTWRAFESSTRQLLFVSDNDLAPDFQALLDLVQGATTVADVAADSDFKFLVDSVSQVKPEVTNETLFNFLRIFKLRPALGSSDDLEGCRAVIADRMIEVSEVEVSWSEGKTMSVSLVAMAKTKSQHKAKAPLDVALLRETKAIALPDLLGLLSLSPDGYRELKETGRTAVRTLSRLHRWCKKLGWPADVIPMACQLKAEWHVWWQANKGVLTALDVLALRTAVSNMLVGQSRPGGTIETLIDQSELVAQRFASTIATTPPISAAVVIGLAFDMAVAAQAGGQL